MEFSIADGKPYVQGAAELLSAVFVADEVIDALDPKRSWVVALDSEESVVGFMAFECLGQYYQLSWICVDGDHYGLGIGRRLVEYLQAYVVVDGGRGIRVETPTDSEARKFYKALGFDFAYCLPAFYGDDRGLAVYVWTY